jgi:EamA domain-containing membrane protein RarD
MINFKNKEKNNTVRVSSEQPVNNSNIDSSLLGFIGVIVTMLCIVISTYILFKFFGTLFCIVFVLFSCAVILYNNDENRTNKNKL